jgi:23S rRNA (adenine2503-C2)-methyltransferase
MTKENIYDLDIVDLAGWIESAGEPNYRTQQIWQGLYRQLWHAPEQFTALPASLRERLGHGFDFGRLIPGPVLFSSDQETRKTLFWLQDGQAVEAVLMRYSRRRTLCISTQSGCGMGCVFCATGQMGFRRHLTSGEIVEQVLFYARQLKLVNEQVTNIVMMGMGEPFHNYNATLDAIDRLNQSDGYNFGSRRFTISTVGLVPMIERFTRENHQVNLAISLHAADDDLRSSMLPINRKYPIKTLLQACHDYVQKTHRRITFEWALIQDVNDTPEQARKLGDLLQVFRQGAVTHCHVNVIPLNPTRAYAGKATTLSRAREFQAALEQRGIPCTIRLRRGIDIQAGCGQLAIEKGSGKKDDLALR